MHLDGYCSELKIAFEHHGKQHYECVTPFVRSQRELEKRKQDDLLKIQLCKAHGIKLVIIEQILGNIGLKRLKAHIKDRCLKAGVTLPKMFDSDSLEFNEAYNTKTLSYLNSLASKNGGKCLSKSYLSVSHSDSTDVNSINRIFYIYDFYGLVLMRKLSRLGKRTGNYR